MHIRGDFLRFLKKCLSSTVFRFIVLGGSNWILVNIIQIIMYNIFGLGYWESSGIAFIITGVEGYLISRLWVFDVRVNVLKGLMKYMLVLGVCFGLSLMISRIITPKIIYFMHFDLEYTTIEVISMVLATIISAVLNYIGQKYFTFIRK